MNIDVFSSDERALLDAWVGHPDLPCEPDEEDDHD